MIHTVKRDHSWLLANRNNNQSINKTLLEASNHQLAFMDIKPHTLHVFRYFSPLLSFHQILSNGENLANKGPFPVWPAIV